MTDSDSTQKKAGRPKKEKPQDALSRLSIVKDIPPPTDAVTFPTTITGDFAQLVTDFTAQFAAHQANLDNQKAESEATKNLAAAELQYQEAIARFPRLQQIIADLAVANAKNWLLQMELQGETVKRQSQSAQAQLMGYQDAIRRAHLLGEGYALNEVSKLKVSAQNPLTFEFDYLPHAVAQ